MKEKFKHWFPKLIGAEAVTFGKTVFYKRSFYAITQRLRKHEAKHVQQYKDYGIFCFLVLYFYWYLLGRLQNKTHYKAYYDIPFEVEARKAERE